MSDSIYTDTVSSYHQDAERRKFSRRDVSSRGSFTSGSAIIQALTASNIVLLPITIDPYGHLSPIASRFLFGTKIDDSQTLSFEDAIAKRAYQLACSERAPSALLPRADKGWKANGSNVPFGRTYHSWFPATWARHVLGLNINLAFAEHFHKHLHAPRMNQPSSTDHYPLAVCGQSRLGPYAT